MEDEIRKQDNMARTIALGGFLRESKGVSHRRQTSDLRRDKERLARELAMWKIRGCLWLGSLACTLAGYSIGTVYYA